MSETPIRAFDPIPPIDLSDEEARAAIERAQAGFPLSAKELAAIFRFKHAQFHNLRKAGQFDQFLANPPIGKKVYSGVKVYRHLCGDPVYEPTFGRKHMGPSSRVNHRSHAANDKKGARVKRKTVTP